MNKKSFLSALHKNEYGGGEVGEILSAADCAFSGNIRRFAHFGTAGSAVTVGVVEIAEFRVAALFFPLFFGDIIPEFAESYLFFCRVPFGVFFYDLVSFSLVSRSFSRKFGIDHLQEFTERGVLRYYFFQKLLWGKGFEDFCLFIDVGFECQEVVLQLFAYECGKFLHR